MKNSKIMKRILLITPPCIKLYAKIRKAAPIYPPLGLLYIASLLEQNNINVKIIDSFALNLKFEEIEREIIRYKPDIVGITSTTTTFSEVVLISNLVKKNFPSSIIIVGGPHVTAIPEEILRNNRNIDIAVRGEGEFTFLKILKKNAINNIEGISFRKGEEIVNNLPAQLIEDINFLPYPLRHLLNIENYRTSSKFPSKKPFTTVLTSRGCPFKCTFCAAPIIFGYKVRKRTPENVILELEEIVNRYKIKEIAFVDDTLTFDHKRLTEICSILKEMKLIWICSATVNTVNEDILKFMSRTGCKAIEFGIESGSERILNNIKKDITLKQAIDAVKWAKKSGILVSTTFIIGHLEEDKTSLEETLKFIKYIDSDILHLSLLTPYPGTEVYNKAKVENRLLRNFEEYISPKYTNPVIKLDSITSEELKKYWKRIMLRFYLRPKTIIRIMKRMFFSWDEFKNIVGGFFAFISSIIKK